VFSISMDTPVHVSPTMSTMTSFYYRRRKALASFASMSTSATKKKAKAARQQAATAAVDFATATSSTGTPTPPPPPPTTTTTATTTTGHETTTTTTRLHLVLQRKTKQELAVVSEELRAHAGVKMVCVYTDSPLMSRIPLSQRQQRILLVSMSEACGSSMTALQLDFSSEFGGFGPQPTTQTQTTTTTTTTQSEILGLEQQSQVLDCDLLATLVQNAHQLESLLLKDVAFKGDTKRLQQVLQQHTVLSKVELKWCTELTPAIIDTSSDSNSSSIHASLLSTFRQMKHLQELNLLVSTGYNLPLVQLVQQSPSLQRITLGLEQRHTHVTALALAGGGNNNNDNNNVNNNNAQQSMIQRHAEQLLVVQVLQSLPYNTTLQEFILYSHHWKSTMTMSCLCDIISSTLSSLKHLAITDYNYGSDDPRKLLELADVLQHNQQLQTFKVVTKKRVSTTVMDKKTRKANAVLIDTAFVETLEHNYTLQSLEICHAGITITDVSSSSSYTKDNYNNHHHHPHHCCYNNNNNEVVPAVLEQPHKPKAMIPFLLETNRRSLRQRFLYAETVNHQDFGQFVIQHNHNSQLLFFILQANPSLLLLTTTATTTITSNNNNNNNNNTTMAGYTTSRNGQLAGRHIWEYYF
jgi:hypothetical protein